MIPGTMIPGTTIPGTITHGTITPGIMILIITDRITIRHIIPRMLMQYMCLETAGWITSWAIAGSTTAVGTET